MLAELQRLDRPQHGGGGLALARPNEIGEDGPPPVRIGGDAQVVQHRQVLDQLEALP